MTSHLSDLFTSHLSPLTSHLSPLTSHLSPLTSHLAPRTSHLSPCFQVHTYLLEKSRVVVFGGSGASASERNFHSFYQLLAGVREAASGKSERQRGWWPFGGNQAPAASSPGGDATDASAATAPASAPAHQPGSAAVVSDASLAAADAVAAKYLTAKTMEMLGLSGRKGDYLILGEWTGAEENPSHTDCRQLCHSQRSNPSPTPHSPTTPLLRRLRRDRGPSRLNGRRAIHR